MSILPREETDPFKDGHRPGRRCRAAVSGWHRTPGGATSNPCRLFTYLCRAAEALLVVWLLPGLLMSGSGAPTSKECVCSNFGTCTGLIVAAWCEGRAFTSLDGLFGEEVPDSSSSEDSPFFSSPLLRGRSVYPAHACAVSMQVLHLGRSPEHLVLRLRHVRQAALILLRLACGWPSVETKRIWRGGGISGAVVAALTLMLRGGSRVGSGPTSYAGGACKR